MKSPLHSSKYCVAHAKRHIEQLKTEIDTYFKSEPYKQVIGFDASGPDDIHKLKLVKAMPEPLSGIAFDAVSSLRAALDQAAHTIGLASGANGKKSAFPFGDTLPEVQSRSKGNGGSKDIPQDLFHLMVYFKPYKDGNIHLWGLNKLCNSHKHEIVIPMAIYTGGGSIKHAYFSSVKSFSFPPRWDSEKQEMILAVVPHRAPTNFDMSVSTFVAIGKIDGIIGKPAIDVLGKIAKTVEAIVDALETKGVDIGIFTST